MAMCPFCNQPMDRVTPDKEDTFTDLFRCGACQVEQAVHWQTGERLLAWDDDSNQLTDL